MKVAALCAGYGGLELGLAHAGIGHELAWWSEIDQHAATVMAAHTAAPNMGDLCAITDPPPVDIITAGFPCQPVSSAGARAGVDDVRWLIRDVVAVWRASGARRLILENVPGLFTANDGDAFGQVLDALAQVGATARWTCVRASDVGAPHRRERWFCVADAPGARLEGPKWAVIPGRRNRPAIGVHAADAGRPGRQGLRPAQPDRRPRPADSGPPAPDPDGREPQRWGGPGELGGQTPAEPGQGDQRERAGHPAGHGRAAPTDAESDEQRGSDIGPLATELGHSAGGRLSPFGPYAPAVERWAAIIGRPAPAPTVAGRLNPEFVEWMMGLPAGWVTACGLSRTQALRVLGNGVVPQQAAHALQLLEAA